jgi:hypothetical protein
MSGITPVQGGPDRSTLSSTVRTEKDSPTDAAKAKLAAQAKKTKRAAQAKKLKLADDAKKAAQAAEAKSASGAKGATATAVDVRA